MPAIVLFGRGWNFSSDDLVFTSLYVILLRLIGVLIVLITLPLLCSDRTLCLPPVVFILTLSGIAVSFLQILIRGFLSVASGTGGIADVSRRTCVPKIFYLHLFCILIEVPIYCAIIYFTATIPDCKNRTCLFLLIVCSLGLLFLAWNIIAFLVTYDSAGKSSKAMSSLWCMEFDDQSEKLEKSQVHLLNANLWNRRLRCLACLRRFCRNQDKTVRQEHRTTMRLVSDIIGHHFSTNVVASDFLCGLLLIRWQTHQWVGCGWRVPISSILRDTEPASLEDSSANNSSSKSGKKKKKHGSVSPTPPLPNSQPVDWLSLHRIVRYMRFSAAAYGRYLYLYAYGRSPKGLCALLKHTSFPSSCCLSNSSSALNSDNAANMSPKIGCCICDHDNCNSAAFYEVTKVPAGSLIHFSLTNKLYFSPFLVAIDDETESIVIAIRGTMSPEDMIVDMLAEGGRIHDEDMPKGSSAEFVVHMGILRTAYELRNSIISLRLIEHARSRRSSYPVVVCGHSLGAGIASVLAFLLQPRYPEVKAYAYSPPLGLMNSAMAKQCKPFVCSVVYGYDMISRLSIPTLNDLKWRILDALTNCHVPKFKLLCRAAKLVSAYHLLPCCNFPRIGLDTKLLDETFQQRLLHPNVPFSRVSSFTNISGSIEDKPFLPHNSHTIGSLPSSTEASNSNNLRESLRVPPAYDGRCRNGPRSLVQWICEAGPVHLLTASNGTRFGTFLTTSSGHVHTHISQSSTSTLTGSSEVHKQYKEDFCSMEEDVQFTGVVLHIVEVEDDSTSSPSTARSRGKRNSTPPVAVWSSPRQFQSLLIHPRMLLDHFPDQLLRALERLQDSCREFDIQHSQTIAAAEHQTSDSFQRIRKLKTFSL